MIESTITVDSKPVRYIPALSFKSLTPFFDLFLRWIGRELTLKTELIESAAIKENFRVLDLGCGTGTLTILIKKSQPFAEITGIDIDPDVLKIAKEKAAKAQTRITFDLGTAFQLPYPDESFDRVVSSLVFHHLTTKNKVRTLKEIFRVLKPLGELHLADLAKPQNRLMSLPSAIMRRMEESKDNYEGAVPEMFRQAGFSQVEEARKTMTLFGTVSVVTGRKTVSA